MARRGRMAVRVRIDGIKQLEERLTTVGLTLRSPAVTSEIQRGADIMAARAQVKAPSDLGNLRRGIYTASKERQGFVQLTRKGRRINSGLRYPPRPGQVVLVSSVYYSLFVERGRKRNSKRGYMRARPYFRSAVRESREMATAFILRRLERLITERWNAGWGKGR